MPLTELHSFIRSMDLSLIKTIQEELLVRLEALINIGLSYLTLDEQLKHFLVVKHSGLKLLSM